MKEFLIFVGGVAVGAVLATLRRKPLITRIFKQPSQK